MYRILYVDDESGLLEIAKLFLEDDGQISVDTQTSAKTALPLILKENYDAVISDYQMPGMNGIELLKRVRASGSSIPFILFTGRGREEIVIQALNEGADFYLQKGGEPVSQFAELSNKIQYAINRKHTEETLREKTGELDRFFTTSLDLLCIADTDGYFHRLNPEWERTLGYPVSELEGKKFLDLVHPDDKSSTIEAVSRLNSQNAILNFENRYRHKDGSYRWIEWRSYPHGNLFYATARDITDRKMSEKVLQESEQKYRNLYTHMVEGAALHELRVNDQGIPEDYVIIETNPAFEKHLGIPRESVIGRTSREAYGVADPPYLELYARVAMTGKSEVFETFFQPLDKYFSISVYSPEKGMFATIFEDITKRRRAEEALRASEEKYRRIVETAMEGIWSMDSEFTTVFVNRKMAEMLGYTTHEMLGRNIMDFMDPEELADNATKLENRIRGINEFYERKFRCRDGSIRWFGVSVTALKDPSGAFGGSFAMLTDITDRKLAEDELKKKNEELGAAYAQLAASEEELRQNLDDLAAGEQELRKSESKFRDLFNNAILGIFRSTPDGRYLDMNPAFARIAGYSSPREMMESVLDIRQLYIHSEDRQKIREMLSTTGEIRSFETEIRRRDGVTIWIAINAKTTRDSSGNILWYDGTIEEITARKKAEAELARWNAELRSGPG
ncbi:PAS domain S-box protein [uncultured Methanoregula sp.]|uniref:PAS domain S-box protein n=1 Tax=uncultured Methanoregula sp. TaxID=1005933 RepID=UPI002AAA92F0|nr:PAS domain S-box protein [uncultured Methanoregula sp.]